MHRLRSLVMALRGSLWFVPAITVAGAIVLGVAVSEADLAAGAWAAQRWPRFFAATPDGARAVLGAIASAMITVTGIVFSMTLVTLSLAASHYGSRVLRQFMRDRANQLVLGTFLGVFAYCLVVVRAVRGGDDPFVPAFAVAIAIAFAFVAIGLLIYYLHHVATSVQAPHIIATLAHETLQAAAAMASRDTGERGPAQPPQPAAARWHPVAARRSGFVATVGTSSLHDLACALGTTIRMDAGAGDFVADGTSLASVADVVPDDETAAAIDGCYAIGVERSIDEDVGYGMRQIVDIALRALSPGVNDPTTAVLCLHWLTVVLRRLVAVRFPPAACYDAEGRLRLIARQPSFDALLHTAYDQVADAAAGDAVVLGHLEASLAAVAAACEDPARQAAIAQLAASLHARVSRDVGDPDARRRLQRGLRRLAGGERRDASAPLRPPGEIDAA